MQQIENGHLGSIPSDYVPILPDETLAIINTEPSNMQGEHKGCKHSSQIVFCRLSRSTQLLQEAVQAKGARATTTPS